MKKLINLILLFTISFSMAHEVVLDTHEDSHCSVQEYVAEFSEPIHHDDEHEHENDICDSHYMFHVSFLLPHSFSISEIDRIKSISEPYSLVHLSSYIENNFRPPIV